MPKSSARSIIGTAMSKLFGFSSAAWPPKLKMPTLYPVLPRLRVGIADSVLGFQGRGENDKGVCCFAANAAPLASNPAATALDVLRKLRRSEGGRGRFI